MVKNNAIPLSLYIHFPWCVRKCPYCDFNSHALREETVPEEKYIEKLLSDLQTDIQKGLTQNRKISSIFMGGGTPSLFSGKAIKQLLHRIADMAPLADTIEITLEANPGTIELEKFQAFYEAGINRLSIGIQSFQKEKLKVLGRIHDDAEAMRAAEIARDSGFGNFNLDLMHGLPAQNTADALYDLKTALRFRPPHLSWYQLTLEPNTLFYHRPPALPAEEILAEIQTKGEELLRTHGYINYEVSAWASQENYFCQHNLNYWQFGDYLGIGAGAHAKITDLNTGDITRYVKIKHPREYLLAENCMASENKVNKNAVIFEFMLNALRLNQAISFQLFASRTGLDAENILPVLKQLQQQKLLSFDANSFMLSPLGQKFLNNVLAEFMQ